MPRVLFFPLLLCLLGVCMLASGCEREPIDRFCPNIGVGELTISEIRGPQGGDTDAMGQWIEIHNPNDFAVEVTGLTVRLLKLDGAGEARMVIRERGLSIEPFGYFVLGRFGADDLQDHVDYGYAADFSGDIYSTGFLKLEACDSLIDQVVWGQDGNPASAPALPSAGTLAFDGATVLTMESNDLGENWCYDESSDGYYQNGTPKEMNKACAQ